MFELSEIGERLRTQDNRITTHPIFEVQEQKRVYGIDTEYDPKIAWLYSDESVDAPPALAALAEAFYQEHYSEPEYQESEDGGWILSEGNSDTLRRVGYH